MTPNAAAIRSASVRGLLFFLLACEGVSPPQIVRATIERSFLPSTPLELRASGDQGITAAVAIRGCPQIAGTCDPVSLMIPEGSGQRLEILLANGNVLPVHFPDGNTRFDICTPREPFELGILKPVCGPNPACDRSMEAFAVCQAQSKPGCELARQEGTNCQQLAIMRCDSIRAEYGQCLTNQNPDCEGILAAALGVCSNPCPEINEKIFQACVQSCASLESDMLQSCRDDPAQCPSSGLTTLAQQSLTSMFGKECGS